MAKICRTCGRARHDGLCDMAELSDGRVVHVSRIAIGGDLREELGKDGLKVANRWIKQEPVKPTDLLKKR